MVRDEAFAVVVLDEGYAFTGGTEGPNANADAFVRRVDAQGDLVEEPYDDDVMEMDLQPAEEEEMEVA